jgi:hypothetical protein
VNRRLKPQPESSTQEVLAGLVERVTFHNAENGFCVIRIKARAGVTRGKRLVVPVGQKNAVTIAVRNISGRRRWSKLNEWLAATAMHNRRKSGTA